MPFVVRGTAGGRTVWWKKWTGACVAGRPKWVDRLTANCLFANQTNAENASNSRHWQLATPRGTPVTDVTVEEVELG